MSSLYSLWMLLGGALLSALFTWATVVTCRRFGFRDERRANIQRVHQHWAPRLGGAPIFLSLALLTLFLPNLPERGALLLLLACAAPAFLAGFVEDLRENLGARVRLAATFVAAWLAWFFIGAELRSVGIPGFDHLLGTYSILAFLFTAFAVGGVAHSINIIDGFNGLSSFYSIICFGALAVVSTLVGDAFVQQAALLACSALIGFLVWNFPFGRVFLGDGGAYLIGFLLAELSVLLVARNPEVSPWFCFLLIAYPIWDTLFSSYRREVKRGQSWSDADALHLHHLIYRRLVRPYERGRRIERRVLLNSMVSVYVWILGIMCAVPAVLFRDSTPILVSFTLLFIVTYGLLYRGLVRFRSPRILQSNRVIGSGQSNVANPNQIRPRTYG